MEENSVINYDLNVDFTGMTYDQAAKHAEASLTAALEYVAAQYQAAVIPVLQDIHSREIIDSNMTLEQLFSSANKTMEEPITAPTEDVSNKAYPDHLFPKLNATSFLRWLTTLQMAVSELTIERSTNHKNIFSDVNLTALMCGIMTEELIVNDIETNVAELNNLVGSNLTGDIQMAIVTSTNNLIVNALLLQYASVCRLAGAVDIDPTADDNS